MLTKYVFTSVLTSLLGFGLDWSSHSIFTFAYHPEPFYHEVLVCLGTWWLEQACWSRYCSTLNIPYMHPSFIRTVQTSRCLSSQQHHYNSLHFEQETLPNGSEKSPSVSCLIYIHSTHLQYNTLAELLWTCLGISRCLQKIIWKEEKKQKTARPLVNNERQEEPAGCSDNRPTFFLALSHGSFQAALSLG